MANNMCICVFVPCQLSLYMWQLWIGRSSVIQRCTTSQSNVALALYVHICRYKRQAVSKILCGLQFWSSKVTNWWDWAFFQPDWLGLCWGVRRASRWTRLESGLMGCLLMSQASTTLHLSNGRHLHTRQSESKFVVAHSTFDVSYI